MIRTLVEIRDGRVSIVEGTTETTVTVTVDGAPSTVPLGGQEERLYTAEEVGDFQASEAELVAAPLRSRITELERKVDLYNVDRTTERDRADRNMARAEKAEAEVVRLKKGHVCTRSCKPNAHVAFTGRQRLEELEQEAHDERERADQNKEWAERAELRLAKDAEVHVRQVAELESELARRTREREDREAARAGQEKRADKAEGSLRESRDLVEFKDRVITGLEEDRDKLFTRVQMLTDSLAARDRLLESATRDLNNVVRQRDAALHGPSGVHGKLADVTKDRQRLAAQISKVNGAVHSPEILTALRTPWQSWKGTEALAIITAVRDTRRAIGSPGSETSPA